MTTAESNVEDQPLPQKSWTRLSFASTSAEVDDTWNAENSASQDDTSDAENSSSTTHSSLQQLGLQEEAPQAATLSSDCPHDMTTDKPISDDLEQSVPSLPMMLPLERLKTNDSFSAASQLTNGDYDLSPEPRWERGVCHFSLGNSFPEDHYADEPHGTASRAIATPQLEQVVTADPMERASNTAKSEEIPSAEVAQRPLERVVTDDPLNAPVDTGFPMPLVASAQPMQLTRPMAAMPVAAMPMPFVMTFQIMPVIPVLGVPLPEQAQVDPGAACVETPENEASSAPKGQRHCGHGRCRPCFEHIRGRCTAEDSCGYCHGEEHITRRKQRKHQRRLQAQGHKNLVDACPQPPGLQMIRTHANEEDATDLAHRESACSPCEVHAVQPVETNSRCSSSTQPCAPCYLHIRKKCLLGNACNYCHDPIHVIRHKERKQQRSNLRAAKRK